MDGLRALAERAYVLDLPGRLFKSSEQKAVLLSPAQFDKFPQEVMGRPGLWTDLLVIPTNLPGAASLIGELTKGMK